MNLSCSKYSKRQNETVHIRRQADFPVPVLSVRALPPLLLHGVHVMALHAALLHGLLQIQEGV